MTRIGRRRLPIRFALAGAALALLLSPVQAQDGSAPAKPTGLTAAVSHDSVTLTWDDPQDDSITGYVVLRRDKNIHEEGTFETVAPDTGSAGTTYTDDTAEPEKQYVYRIKAISADGLSEISNWVRAYTPVAPTPEPPAAPSGLTAAVSHDSVTLTWDDPGDDSITGYVILRRNRDTDAEGQFTELVNDTGSAATAYTDGTVAAETPYTYRIKAINGHGVSERSRWFHIDTPAAPEPTPEPTPEPESVSEGDSDLPNDNSTPGRVAIGGLATGAIATAGDQDRFAVELEAGRTYQFDLAGSPGGGGTLPDTYFRAIYDSAGQYQAASYNDDFDGGRDSRVTFTASESGTYYARVSGDRDETGSYTLRVTDVTLQQAALTHTRVAAAGGQRVSRPARVQTPFVSNLGQTDISRDTTTDPASPYAQQFETGSNSGGYTLTEIVVNIRDAQTGSPAFALHTDAGDNPGTKVMDLSGNSSTAGEQSFTPDSTTTLNPSTKYYIVFSMTSGTANLQRTSSDNIDSGASPGWDIAENSLFGTGTTWTTSGDTVEIAIKGTAVGGTLSTDATLSDLVVNDGNADLTLTPTFASGTTTYTASVVSTVTAVTVTPMTTDTVATIEYLDGDDATLDDAGTADGHQVTLAEGENVIKVKVTAADGNTTETYMVTVDRAAANNAPTFPTATLTRTVPENTAVNQNVGAAIPAATDADAGDTLTYSMEGADADAFTFEASTRRIQTSAALDYEAKPSYSVTIKVSDGTASDTIDVTITVTDEDEPPAAPAPPTLTATPGSTTSLDVSWTAPANAGKPPITGYDLHYRVGSSGSWTDGPQDETVTTAAISGLTAATEYQVQVRASNAEGDSGWSAAGTGSTNTPVNNAPAFSLATATRSIAENTAANQNVGAAIPAATDADGDTLEYTLEGTDAASFGLVSTSGQIRTKAGVTYDHETTSSYSVTVKADDGNGGTDTIAVTITVTDIDEQPDKPAKPTVTATVGSTTSLDVSWTEPGLNGGPEITGYQLQYQSRASATDAWSGVADWTHTGTATMTTITGLTADTEYQVRVQALNGEKPSDWSDSSDAVRTVTTDPDDVTLPILDADPVGMGGVCDRTLRIRDRILVLLKHRHSFKGGCGDVNETHLAKLKSLDLGRNPSTESAFTLSLQSDDFKGLVNLERLYMRETGLRLLPAGVFSGLAKLDTLDLGKNQLRLLPAGVFSDLQALTRLDLSKNPSLLSPPFDEFEALPNLTKLRVDSVGRHQLEVVGNAALEVAAGGSVTYQVRLLAAPSFKVTDDNPLTIEVSSDTDGVVATPASLPFTRENWFRSQTVTVSALSSASGTAELAHEGSGTTTDSQGYPQSNYDFEDYPLPKVTVRVR